MPNEEEQKLIAVLQRVLTDNNVREGSIPYHQTIPALAHDLLVMKRHDTSAADISERRKKLNDLAKKSSKFSDELEQSIEHPSLLCSENGLAAVELINRIAEFIRNVKKQEQSLPVGAPGRPKETAATSIARRLSDEYGKIVGQRPTRITHDGVASGPFFDWVKDVFELLDINISAEAAIKRVMENIGPKTSK